MNVSTNIIRKNRVGLLLITSLISTCFQRSKEIVKTDFTISYTVKSAPEWTQLFYRKDGWFGGDGIFSIPLFTLSA